MNHLIFLLISYDTLWRREQQLRSRSFTARLSKALSCKYKANSLRVE